MVKNILISTDADWRRISWEKPISEGTITYFSDLPFVGNRILKKTLRFFYSWKINLKVRVPFRRILYKGILRALNVDCSDEVKIIFYDRSRASYDFKLIKYLRKKIPGVRIGYLFSDIVSKSGAQAFNIVYCLNEYYDKVFSFDKNDAKKYGFNYSYLIYDRIISNILPSDLINDVFLVAQAKNRLTDLLQICDKCFELNLKTDFVINKIPYNEVELIGSRDIQVNTIIPYEEVVKRLLNSKCIIDIMQKGSIGITLNIVEAVIFNKKAISNNVELVNEPFYDPSRILIINENSNIETFLAMPMTPYTDEDKSIFSGLKLFEHL